MSKISVTFIEEVSHEITHGGVTFTTGKPVIIDKNEVETFPWFEGNASFTITEIEDETTENQTVAGDVSGNSDAGDTGEKHHREDEEAEANRRFLDEHKVKYRKNASDEKLRDLVAQFLAEDASK